MDWSSLVDLVARVRATSKKNDKVGLIADALRQARGREIELVALYLTGALAQGRIGIGYRTLQAAMPSGPAAGEPLTLERVDEALGEIAGIAGAGSTERRARALHGLLERTDEAGRRLMFELLTGEVRQGALEGLVVEAIARAASLPPAEVRQAAMFAGSVGEIARAALEDGAAGLGRFSLRLLSPVAPMLASPAGDAAEAIERLGEAAFEYKVDGARLQVHRAGDEVRVFTRHLQDVTARVPEVVEWARGLPVREAVVEGEAIALRPDGRPRPFQETMRRLGRRLDVDVVRREIPLSSFFFDCLYLEGDGALVARPYAERAERLRRLVAPSSLLPRIVTRDPDEVDRFFDRALTAGHEGLMAKSLAAPYAAGQRGFHWLPAEVALEPAPRRARRGERAVRDARQDVQGPDRRDAGVADGEAHVAAGLDRRLDGRRAPGAGGGDRVLRRTGVAALPRRPRPALRTPEAIPAREARGRGRHDPDGARHLREAASLVTDRSRGRPGFPANDPLRCPVWWAEFRLPFQSHRSVLSRPADPDPDPARMGVSSPPNGIQISSSAPPAA
jgi:DNA ligase-1